VRQRKRCCKHFGNAYAGDKSFAALKVMERFEKMEAQCKGRPASPVEEVAGLGRHYLSGRAFRRASDLFCRRGSDPVLLLILVRVMMSSICFLGSE
jgi:hypothetical protein